MSTGVGGYAWSQVVFRGRYVREGYIPGMGMLGNGYVWGWVCPGGEYVQVVGMSRGVGYVQGVGTHLFWY